MAEASAQTVAEHEAGAPPPQNQQTKQETKSSAASISHVDGTTKTAKKSRSKSKSHKQKSPKLTDKIKILLKQLNSDDEGDGSSDDDDGNDASGNSDGDSSSESEACEDDERVRKPSDKKNKSNTKQKSNLRVKIPAKSKSKSKQQQHRGKSKKNEPSSPSFSASSDDSSYDSSDDEPKPARSVSQRTRSSDGVYDDELESRPLIANHSAPQMAARPCPCSQRRVSFEVVDNAFAPSNSPGSRSAAQKGTKDKHESKRKTPAEPGSKLQYKRLDEMWDKERLAFRLKQSSTDPTDQYSQYVLTVRRKFDPENKYLHTKVDIVSKHLRKALREVLSDVKMVSLVEEKPSLDPNILFLYLEELRTHANETLKSRCKDASKKTRRYLTTARKHLEVLLKYLDKDYDETKKRLYPMLEAGNITFDLLWALFKPNTLAFTTTYGAVEHPRCFRVEYAHKCSSFTRGDFYCIEGQYLDYDGKNFGFGEFDSDVGAFKGSRKITSLPCYPLKYHKDADGVRVQLLERGKKFVALEGFNYRFHKGLAFRKKRKNVLKVNVNGRVVVDPQTFRRIDPNYEISSIKKEDDDLFDMSDSECSCCSDCEDEHECNSDDDDEAEKKERIRYKLIYNDKNEPILVQVPVNEDGLAIQQVENLEALPLPEGRDPLVKREFTEEELVIASPVVLGFSFNEKVWLEFSVSGIHEIEWNEGAFDSLVLPDKQKSLVRALVGTHKFNAAKTIDDVVQGKGKGLVAVLHGPPGVGKTLTAEGIAEMLRCPLYTVSVGELGTDARSLEVKLQEILDIAHSWGAVLLLDEADVFLEHRQPQDIHRNALVSVFLRLLEYFQGILFLTTNRVKTFDEAFQSRIHIALQYGALTTKAKKAVWKLFVEKVREVEKQSAGDNGVAAAAIGASEKQRPGNTATSAAAAAAAATATVTPTDASSSTSDDTASQDTPSAASSPSKHARSKSKPKNEISITEDDYDMLARRELNGRQIKNCVRSAQALALNEDVPLSLVHIKRVLDVAESFEQDLKGGAGYQEAMRSYA